MFIKHQRDSFKLNYKRFAYQAAPGAEQPQQPEAMKITAEVSDSAKSMEKNFKMAQDLIAYYGDKNPKSQELQKAVDDYQKAKEADDSSKEFMAAKLSSALQTIDAGVRSKVEAKANSQEQNMSAQLDKILAEPDTITASPEAAQKARAARQAEVKEAENFGMVGLLKGQQNENASQQFNLEAKTEVKTEQPVSMGDVPPNVRAVLQQQLSDVSKDESRMDVGDVTYIARPNRQRGTVGYSKLG